MIQHRPASSKRPDSLLVHPNAPRPRSPRGGVCDSRTMSANHVDATTLTLQITGLLPEEGSHIREVLFDEIETRLPRDAEARVNIQLSELNPGRTASWHVHNGIVYFVLVRGAVSLQYEG